MQETAWAELIRRFELCDLSAAEWTHQAHLAAAAWYLTHYAPLEAGQRIRDGIRKLNESLGGKNTEDSGFHETLTEFWMREVHARLDRGEGLAEILALPSGFWRNFYSIDLPKSREARLHWLPPDRKPALKPTTP
jgi:hypothetical protein